MPLLADGMPTVSADGKTYTVKIHDGRQLRERGRQRPARDDRRRRRGSINRVLDPNLKPNPSPVASGFFGNIVGADAMSWPARPRRPRGSRSSTRRPSSSTWSMPTRHSSTSSPRRSPRSCPRSSPATDATAFSAKPVGTGPVPVRRATPRARARPSSSNPTYWQAGQPYLDEIDYKTGQDDNAMLLQIEAGTLDMMGDPMPAGTVHRRDDEPRLHGPDLPPHAGRHRLRVHGHAAGRTTARSATSRSARRSTTPIDKAAILQISHGAGVEANCILPAGPARLRRRPATRIRTTSRRPRR